jgi:hypothetical protein
MEVLRASRGQWQSDRIRALRYAERLAIEGHDLVLNQLVQVVADELRELLARKRLVNPTETPLTVAITPRAIPCARAG